MAKTYELIHQDTLKVLKILTLDDPKALSLFKKEADVLNLLNHPGIPKGYGYFTFFARNSHTPVHCLVMQKIEGTDLEKYLQGRGLRPIDEKLALEWLLQLANILHQVHSQNFLHRDIKPSNIMIQPRGQLALIDFGAVRQVTATIMAGNQNTKIYTAGYAPPEQEKGYAVQQSDFFALGRTFVYLLTGKEPLNPAIYDPHNDKLNWRSHAPTLSPILADFIDQLMEREASKRPANTQVILQRIEEIDRALNPPPVPPTIPITSVQSTPVTKPPSQSGGQQQTRRNFITTVSLAGGGLVVGLLIREVFKGKSPSETIASNPSSGVSSSPTPLPSGEKKNLQKFQFDVVTLNRQGQIINRSRNSANFFSADLGNGVTLEMVAIPGGTFLMGSPETEKDRDKDESPQHSVTVKSFSIGKFTVTQAQWRAVASLPQVNTSLKPDPSYFKGDHLPVEEVSWNDAVEFCARLSKKTGCNYRLPSEAEWEYACRAGTTTPFHFGETITSDVANYDGTSIYASEPKGTYRQKTTSVGSFQVANAFGLYDMHGNVWEWCADIWHENYNGASSDGSVWEFGGDDKYRLLRGGSWCSHPWNCRAALRGRYAPDTGTPTSVFVWWLVLLRGLISSLPFYSFTLLPFPLTSVASREKNFFLQNQDLADIGATTGGLPLQAGICRRRLLYL